jgi:hypothetical protein
MFNSSEVQNEKQFVGKYITCGVQELRINKIEIKVAATGTKQLVFNTEGKECTQLGFEGVDGAKGPIGKISTFYMKPEQEQEVTTIFARIADAVGTREQLNAVKAATLEEYVEAANKILTNKFANFAVGGEEYSKDGGRVGVKLSFPKFNFVEKIGTTPSTVKYDPTNKFHYKKLVQPDNVGEIINPDNAGTPVIAPHDDSQLPF